MATKLKTTNQSTTKGLMRPRMIERRPDEIEAAASAITGEAAAGSKMQSWTIRTSMDLHRRAKAKAALEGTSLTAIVRDALERFVGDK